MRAFLIAAALSVLVTPALAGDHSPAPGGLRLVTDVGVIRAGARCGLSIHGVAAGGRCIIGRGYGSPSTIIRAGDEEYEIRRTSRTSARFVRTTDGLESLVGTVYADGVCWVGANVAFCAPD